MRSRSPHAARLTLYFTFMGLLALAWWCSTGERAPDLPSVVVPPRGTAGATLPPAPVSTVVVPVTIPLAVVTDALEEKVPKVLVDEAGKELRGGLTLDAHVARTGRIGVEAREGDLALSLPLETRITVHGRRDRRSLDLENALVLEAALGTTITPSWGLEPDVDIGFRWTRPPELDVGPLHLDLRERLDPRLLSKLDGVEPQVEERIRGRDLLRPQVERAWSLLAEPLALSDAPPTWIRVEPMELLASDPRWTAAGLSVRVGLRGRFSVLSLIHI